MTRRIRKSGFRADVRLSVCRSVCRSVGPRVSHDNLENGSYDFFHSLYMGRGDAPENFFPFSLFRENSFSGDKRQKHGKKDV